MKAPFIFTCACAAALVLPFSSCSTQNSSTGGYDTAEPASGEIPPWIAESSDPAYESGHYSPVKSSSSSSSYAYNPPAKPSVSKKSPTRRTTTSSAKSSRNTVPKKSTARKPAPKARTYTVKKGDTLGAIARRNGTSVKALKKANGLKSDMIHINQKLSIPRSK